MISNASSKIAQENTMNKTAINAIPEAVRSNLYGRIKNIICSISYGESQALEEIRMKIDKPLLVGSSRGDFFVSSTGTLTENYREAYIVSEDDLTKTLELMSDSSVYAVQDELINGYITIRGGHRVGVVGKVLVRNGSIYNLKNISSLNIRIAREVIGAADKLMEHVFREGYLQNTLIISPPQCGKTTMLRDIARQLSNGNMEKGFKGVKVGIVDERSEIAACFRGVPQNEVGIRTDVLDGCPKTYGIYMMLRSMSPDVIITDEIGTKEDVIALSTVLNAGVKIVTTVHGYGRQDVLNRTDLRNLIMGNLFDKIVVLSNANGPGTIEEIWERNQL